MELLSKLLNSHVLMQMLLQLAGDPLDKVMLLSDLLSLIKLSILRQIFQYDLPDFIYACTVDQPLPHEDVHLCFLLMYTLQFSG
ncbi:hypothetical protein D3C76_1033870 [compost metagenome]